MAKLVDVSTAKRLQETDGATVTREFDAADNKGRRFGAMAYTFAVAYEACTEQYWDFPQNLESAAARAAYAGTTRYGFRPHALRDGRPFGACHSPNEFATVAERDAAVRKYFAAAEKRALKNKARAKGVA